MTRYKDRFNCKPSMKQQPRATSSQTACRSQIKQQLAPEPIMQSERHAAKQAEKHAASQHDRTSRQLSITQPSIKSYQYQMQLHMPQAQQAAAHGKQSQQKAASQQPPAAPRYEGPGETSMPTMFKPTAATASQATSHGSTTASYTNSKTKSLYQQTGSKTKSIRTMLNIIAIITLSMLLTLLATPQAAQAADTASTATSSQYQLYNSKQKNQQITINKIWNDGLTNDDRKSGSTPYQNMLAISIMTGVPQSTLRTYQIVFDANGGSYGTDSNGNSITTNTLTYNSKNAVTTGTYAVPEHTDGYTCIGWGTSSTATSADSTATNAVNNPSLTNQWLNARTDKSKTTLYAVWKDLRIHYAIMAYGTGVDIDKDGKTMGLTFGPALGYPEFSQYNGEGTYSQDTTVTPTMTRHHTTADTAVMDETAAACTDDSHSIITDTDAGTDAAGNKYRCLHYDNWNTIIYWNNKDPHVYDKCIKKGCSKTVLITPTQATINNGIFSTSSRTFTGDGDSYIVTSMWDNVTDWSSQYQFLHVTSAKQGYGASLIRAKLVGADSHTNTAAYYAGSDALTKYTATSSILSCFPKNLQDAIGYKNLSGNTAANYSYDIASNDGICDKLWLFSPYEVNSGGKTIYADNSISQDNFYNYHKTRTSKQLWWLRSPGNSDSAWNVGYDGIVYGHNVSSGFAVSPGFSLAAN